MKEDIGYIVRNINALCETIAGYRSCIEVVEKLDNEVRDDIIGTLNDKIKDFEDEIRGQETLKKKLTNPPPRIKER